MAIKIALAGNPNCGKTTLFNELTGSNQYVGNWPGVTVEKKDGQLKGHKDVVIQDLPGIYSLSPYTLEDKVIISVVDPNTGEKIIDDIEVPADDLDDDVTLPFEENDVPEGTYRIVVTSYDDNGDQLGEPKTINYSYEKEKAPIVPDTGSFAEHLNVSKTDYLIVGLAAAGFAIIALAVLIIKRSKR